MMQRCWILRVVTSAAGCAILTAVSLLGYWVPGALGYCLNLTPSEPVGIYRVVPGVAEHGVLVWLKQPEGPATSVLHRYIPANISLIKRVVAIRGDIVQVGTPGVSIDGKLWPDSAPLHRDIEGRILQPYPFGTYRVPAGQLWVMSEHPRGIDSRYFGPVLETNVISQLVPVIVWSSQAASQMLVLAYIIFITTVALLLAMAAVKNFYALVINPRELRQE